MNKYEEIIYSLICNSEKKLTAEEMKILNQADAIYNTYNDLTKRLECPLEVVFEAYKGFYIPFRHVLPTEIISIDILHQLILFRFPSGEGSKYVPFEYYKKTWWLKEDRSE